MDVFMSFKYISISLTSFEFFWYFSNQQKTRIAFLRRSVKISARELRSETISCIFGGCRYQNNPRLSWSLKSLCKFWLYLGGSVFEACKQTWFTEKNSPWQIQLCNVSDSDVWHCFMCINRSHQNRNVLSHWTPIGFTC